jgi:hypothetical protein
MDSIWRWCKDLLNRDEIFLVDAIVRDETLERKIWNNRVENFILFEDYKRWLAVAKKNTNYIPTADIDGQTSFTQEFDRIFGFPSKRTKEALI